MPRDSTTAVSASEAKALFADLTSAKALVLAVSGGPDSTALMVLAARWRKTLKRGPELIAVTIDHGLRKESGREARAVATLAKSIVIAHRTVRWAGVKPKTGIPQAAREARYRLLAQAARKAGASHVLTAHTRDDQAETVLIRMSRGSGITGLAAMRRASVLSYPSPERGGSAARSDLPLAGGGEEESAASRRPGMTEIILVRPFLDIPKSRLIATLEKAKTAYADDPTNRDVAFTRARLRGLMPALAAEGLDARRLSVLARRLRRADEAIEVATDRAMEEVMLPQARTTACFDASRYFALPAELALRALGRAILVLGTDYPIELAKLEVLQAALGAAGKSGKRCRRTLAGALVTLEKGRITVETAPARRTDRRNALTTAAGKRAAAAKSR